MELWAGLLASAGGLVVAGFVLFAPIIRAGAPSPPSRPWGACVATMGTNLSAPDHVSLFSQAGAAPILPVALLALLPAVACLRHLSTGHRRWAVLLWILAGLDLLIVPISSCNAVLGMPAGLLTLLAASAATFGRRGASMDVPAWDEASAAGTSVARRAGTADAGIRVDIAGVAAFLLLCFLISWASFIGLRSIGVPFGIRVPIGMFGPALAAVIVRRVRKEGFADSGIGFRTQWRAYGIAYALAPALIMAGILLSAAVGVQHFDLARNLHHLADAIVVRLARVGRPLPPGMSADALATQSAVVGIVGAATVAPFINAVFAMGEEFGWRGYLLPRLEPLGRARAAILVGIAWGFWHAPLTVLDGFNYPDHRYAGVVWFLANTVPFGVVLAWLRFRFKSIWPGALLHGALNAWAGLGLLLLSRGDSFLGAPLGIAGLVPVAAVAIWLVATGRLRTANRAPGARGVV